MILLKLFPDVPDLLEHAGFFSFCAWSNVQQNWLSTLDFALFFLYFAEIARFYKNSPISPVWGSKSRIFGDWRSIARPKFLSPALCPKSRIWRYIARNGNTEKFFFSGFLKKEWMREARESWDVKVQPKLWVQPSPSSPGIGWDGWGTESTIRFVNKSKFGNKKIKA